MGCFGIAEVARRVGVHAGTLRNWEHQGRIGPVARDYRGRRIFGAEDIEAIRLIAGKAKQGVSRETPPRRGARGKRDRG